MRLTTFQRDEDNEKFKVSVNNHVRDDKSSMFAVLKVRDGDGNTYSFHFEDVFALREFAAEVTYHAWNPNIVEL